MNEKAEERPITVGELIELLKKFPADTPVWLEGCDCIGGARGVVTLDNRYYSDGELLITRVDGVFKHE